MEDGNLIVHQSGLETFMRCPEQVRQGYITDRDKQWVDTSAPIGTAVHTAAEHRIKYGTEYTTEDVIDIFLAILAENPEGYRWSKYDENKPYGAGGWAVAIDNCLDNLFRYIEEEFEDRGWDVKGAVVEEKMSAPLCVSHNGTPIVLRGSPDLVIADAKGRWRCFDWKTGSPKKKWQLDRHGLQDKSYLHLLHHNGFEGASGFTWVHLNEFAEINVDWPASRPALAEGRLTSVAQSLATMIEVVGLDTPWPLSSNDWHCSPRWCATYARGECLGAFPHPDHKPQMQKMEG